MRAFIAAIAVAACLGAALPACAQDAEPLALNVTREWEGPADDGRVFAFDGARMTLMLRAGGEDWIEAASLILERAGAKPWRFEQPAGLFGFGQVGIYEMGLPARPVLVFGTYSGGAHCCMQIVVLDLTDPQSEPLEVGWFNGGTVEPEDADGDGSFEFVVRDERFNYTFDSYAGSFPPTQVLALRGGAVADLSADPAFRHLFAADFNAMAPLCSGEEWGAGACAGLLGAAARLGLHDGVRGLLADGFASGRLASGWESYDFCLDDACEERVSFTDFGEAVTYALREWGYLPADD